MRRGDFPKFAHPNYGLAVITPTSADEIADLNFSAPFVAAAKNPKKFITTADFVQARNGANRRKTLHCGRHRDAVKRKGEASGVYPSIGLR